MPSSSSPRPPTSGQPQLTNAFPELARDLQFFPLGVDNPQRLTPAQIEQYNERGYLFPIDVFTDREMVGIRRSIDDLLDRALAAGWHNYDVTNWHKYCQPIWDLVTNARVLDIVQDLLGDAIICRHSHLFAKLPGDGKRVSWHQDASYWPLSKSKVVSAWLAIDDVDVGNSAMQVIPRSHRGAQIPFARSTVEENNVLDQRVDDPTKHGEAPVAIELKAGQMSLHSDWILHGSEPNISKRRRCGLAMRYLTPEVRAYHGWNKHSVICRGEDPTGHWAHHPRPRADRIPAPGVDVTKAPLARDQGPPPE